MTPVLGDRPCISIMQSVLQAPGQALTAAEDSDSDAEGDDFGGGSVMGGMYDAEEMEVSLEDEEALAAFMVSFIGDRESSKAVAPHSIVSLLKARLHYVSGQSVFADVTGAEASNCWRWHSADNLWQVQMLEPVLLHPVRAGAETATLDLTACIALLYFVRDQFWSGLPALHSSSRLMLHTESSILHSLVLPCAEPCRSGPPAAAHTGRHHLAENPGQAAAAGAALIVRVSSPGWVCTFCSIARVALVHSAVAAGSCGLGSFQQGSALGPEDTSRHGMVASVPCRPWPSSTIFQCMLRAYSCLPAR